MNLIKSTTSIFIFILLPAIINAQNLFNKTKDMGSGFKYLERTNALPAEVEKLSLLNEKTGNHLFPQNNETLFINTIIDSSYLLDSVIYHALTDTIKYNYEYNSNRKMTGILRKKWINNEWSNQYQDIIRRNRYGNRDTVISQEWKDNKWTNIHRYYNIYNSNDTITIYEKWEEEHWQNEQRTTYSYDNNGYPVSVSYEDWINDNWELSLRETFEYDTQGNLTIAIWQQWKEGELVQSGRTTYSYDSFGNNTVILFEDGWGGEWVKTERLSYFYNSIGKDTLYLKESWWQSRQVWVNVFRWITAYDSSGNKVESIEEYWPDNKWELRWHTTWGYNLYGNLIHRVDQHRYLNQWANASNHTYVYNERHNLINELLEQWNGSRWIGDYRIAYSFNSNSNLITYLYESWDGKEWIKGPYGQHSFYFEDWLFQYPGYWVELFYSTITAVINNKSNELHFNLSQNYPNPFNPTTKIKYTVAPPNLPQGEALVSLKVYDILGDEITTLVNKEQTPGSYEVEFDASQYKLSSGIYFYVLQTGEKTLIKKMCLIK